MLLHSAAKRTSKHAAAAAIKLQSSGYVICGPTRLRSSFLQQLLAVVSRTVSVMLTKSLALSY